MAFGRNTTEKETEMSNKPTHNAYQVRNFKSGDKDLASWTKIGSAWAHDDGQGFNIRLHATPIDGNIVVRTARERPPTEADDEQG